MSLAIFRRIVKFVGKAITNCFGDGFIRRGMRVDVEPV